MMLGIGDCTLRADNGPAKTSGELFTRDQPRFAGEQHLLKCDGVDDRRSTFDRHFLPFDKAQDKLQQENEAQRKSEEKPSSVVGQAPLATAHRVETRACAGTTIINSLNMVSVAYVILDRLCSFAT